MIKNMPQQPQPTEPTGGSMKDHYWVFDKKHRLMKCYKGGTTQIFVPVPKAIRLSPFHDESLEQCMMNLMLYLKNIVQNQSIQIKN